MTPAQVQLYESGKRRGIGPTVLSRIVRLNPNWQERTPPRGWHPAPSLEWARMRNLVGLQDFIKGGGTVKAWRAIPNGLKWKEGRRRYITRETLLDNIWKSWSGDSPPCPVNAWFPTKKYANDKALEIEYISAKEFLARRAAA
jgi:hypothetical protein